MEVFTYLFIEMEF